MRIKLFALALILSAAVFAIPAVYVEYRNNDTEIVKKASISDLSGDKPYFRTKGRKVEINAKKLHYIDIFPDTIEIYYGDTWCRAYLYPAVKKEAKPVVWHGWMKISTVLSGAADFGKLSASISELKLIHFKPKELSEKNKQDSDPAHTASDTTTTHTASDTTTGTQNIQSEDTANGNENAQ